MALPQASTLLIHNADCIATQDGARRELRDASIFIRGNVIEHVGPSGELPPRLLDEAGEVIDARHHLVTPGLVNTHHHMFQSLTRAIPAVQNAELFGWLRGLYPVWGGLTPEMVYVSTQVAMAELLMSGCTTSSDHLYIFPNGFRLDDSIEAAREMGMRFTASRGSMSVGQSKGGLPPDGLVEAEDFILKDSERLIRQFHDAQHGSMTQIALAPCSPFSAAARSAGPPIMSGSGAAAAIGTKRSPPAGIAPVKEIVDPLSGDGMYEAFSSAKLVTSGP